MPTLIGIRWSRSRWTWFWYKYWCMNTFCWNWLSSTTNKINSVLFSNKVCVYTNSICYLLFWTMYCLYLLLLLWWQYNRLVLIKQHSHEYKWRQKEKETTFSKTFTVSWLNSQPLPSYLQKPWIITFRQVLFPLALFVAIEMYCVLLIF